MSLAQPPHSCKIYTPRLLADAMVDALQDGLGLRWLEPSYGKGAFLQALARRNVSRERIVAIDLDPTLAPADELANTYRGIDFLRWAGRTPARFDRIVGNPPYVAITRLPTSLQRVAAAVTDLSGRPIGLGANTWYAFVLAAMRLLNPGGCLAFVLPASAEFADYSADIRQAVRTQFERLELYRCDRPLFAEVQEGNLVVIARNRGPHDLRVIRKRFQTPSKLFTGLGEGGTANGRPCPQRPSHDAAGTVLLGEVADIRLGGVTGDAAYFLMSEERRRELELPLSAVTRVVTRARHLRSASMDETAWNALKGDGERVWLFNPSEAARKHPAVQKYLRRRRNGCNRLAFKVANRTPWYRTPLPKQPHAFLSGMGARGPWLCLNEMPRLNATNTLYVVTFKDTNVKAHYGYGLSLLTTGVRRQVRRAGRRYAQGLIKYEPGSLARLQIPLFDADVDYRPAYVRALRALLGGSETEAIRIADNALHSGSMSAACAALPPQRGRA